MSIVKYHNSKTGRILVYESTPHYDPISKQNRPKRKYLGYETPDTHEFIPSSGKRGRPSQKKEANTHETSTIHPDYEALYKSTASALVEQEKQLQSLHTDLKLLREENRQFTRKIQEYEKTIQAIHNLTAHHGNN